MSADLSSSPLGLEAFASGGASDAESVFNSQFFAAVTAAAAVSNANVDLPSDLSFSMSDMSSLSTSLARNATKTLKCPKCNWHYKYHETLEIHMKEKHSDGEVKCLYCVENRQHPRLARGETYSCGYKPYRCEVCKYSTTTKGNLSIHMQSDKHLHAVSDMPSLVPSVSMPTTSSASSSMASATPRSPSSLHPDHAFVCLVCGVFSSDNMREMLEHIEKDRSRTLPGDVSNHGGQFRCHLCPYSTPLKANFHLHARTDKHLQRIQMVNHIREGNPVGSSLARFGAVKSLVQVLCRRCNEIATTSESLRDHVSSALHRGSASELLFDCTLCPFATKSTGEAIAHQSAAHDASTWSRTPGSDVCASFMTTSSSSTSSSSESALTCPHCSYATQEESDLGVHSSRHERDAAPCPLCEEPTERKDIRTHLLQVHNTAESAVPRLLAATFPPFSHADLPAACRGCQRRFRSEKHRDEHSLVHTFRALHQCGQCSYSSSDRDDVERHASEEHPAPASCSLCKESFPSVAAFVAHSSSHEHLDSAKRALEASTPADLSLQLGDLIRGPSAFRCNLCTISFPTSPLLDSHLQSSAHQNRMVRVAELVAAAEIDADKPILELPGGPPQKFIRDLIDDEPSSLNGASSPSSSPDSTTPPLAPSSGAATDASPSSMAVPQMAMAAQMLNMTQMIQLMQQQLAAQQQTVAAVAAASHTSAPSGSNGDVKEEPMDEDDDSRPPRDEASLFAALERLGDPAVMAQARDLQESGRLATLRPDAWLRASRSPCPSCGEKASSLMALRSHWESSHASSPFPAAPSRDFVARLKAEGERAEKESSGDSDDAIAPPAKKVKIEPSEPTKAPDLSQFALFNMLQASAAAAAANSMGGGGAFGGFPGAPFLPHELMANIMRMPVQSQMALPNSAKRARTRITDDQLKVLRQYFDINNSPTEEQIREMSGKAALPEKVIKHWFRNTLFKERQRDKDSPYNFSNPPQMGIDLDTYEKTGEARVVQLNTEPSSTPSPAIVPKEEKKVKEETPKVAPPPTPMATVTSQPSAQSLPPPLDLQSMLSSMAASSEAARNNPFANFPVLSEASSNLATMLAGGIPQIPSLSASPVPASSVASSASGRRANRTRFTDVQLRTLQEFFDKQAYPKDDDLEVLSRKLSLSPRVIVVWFQNARQKARKIYENQPAIEGVERFVRTPGCNFQCKRCSLVFQRYYELIEHQQKKCYKDDSRAAADDNKNVEANLSTEERGGSAGPSSTGATGAENTSNSASAPATTATVSIGKPVDLAAFLTKSTTDMLLKLCDDNTRSASASSTHSTSPTNAASGGPFHKRCPLCALLFRSAVSMQDHMGARHPEHPPIDLDLLPDADDVRAALDPLRQSQPLDLSACDRGLSISPFLSNSDGDDVDDECGGSVSPMNLGGGAAPRSPASGSSGNKRYRTHLTPTQVHVMKGIFTDYRTPSMSECEMLGREVGLHKRVVQVWFQNARAKERKSRSNGDEAPRPVQPSCTLCNLDYSTVRTTMNEHLFSSAHIAALKSGTKDDGDGHDDGSSYLRIRAPAVRDSGGPSPSKKAATAAAAIAQPFLLDLLGNLQGIAAVANGGMPLYDPALLGTPIPMLHIPSDVATQITADLAAGRPSTTFSQDGVTVESARADLPPDDATVLEGKDVQVGWACPGCTNVFQKESQLATHQKSVCTTVNGSFGLIQTHYRCTACESLFGSQKDFKAHIGTPEHAAKRDA